MARDRPPHWSQRSHDITNRFQATENKGYILVGDPGRNARVVFANGLNLQTALIAAIEAKGLFRALTNRPTTFAITGIDINSARFVGGGRHQHPDLISRVTRGALADCKAVQ